MVVTMVAMGMVQMPVHQVIHMITVGYCRMTAFRAMHMPWFMSCAMMRWRAYIRVGCRYRNHMFIHMGFMRMMQVPIVQVIDMAFMHNGRMPTIRPMLVGMLMVMRVFTGCHSRDSFSNGKQQFNGRKQPQPHDQEYCAAVDAHVHRQAHRTYVSLRAVWSQGLRHAAFASVPTHC